ncbi:MAG: hypothetical protein V3V18_08835 [Methylococcales bacterium]
MQKPFSIEARSYDIAGVASHNFWVLRDGENKVVAQLHGLATDRTTNMFKPLGYFNDRLGFYEFKSAKNDPNFITGKQHSLIVYQGDEDDVLARWNKASCQIDALNQLDLNYSPFGILGLPITNSNSAYHLFSQLIGVECCHFSGVLQPGIHNNLSYCQVFSHTE